MDEDKTLEAILEQLSTKSTVAEFFQAFELAVEHLAELKTENGQERDDLKNQLEVSLAKAQERLKTDSNNEWDKMWAKVDSLTNGLDGRDGTDGRDGRDGKDGKDAKDGRDGKQGLDGSPDTPDEIIAKINKSSLLISKERIDGLLDALGQMIQSSMPVTTSFFNGLRAKNLTINGATASQRGDTVFLTVSGTGGGQVNSVVAGTGISVDSTDPANPIVSATGTAFTVLVPTGTVNGTNTLFTFTIAPSVIVLDNMNVMNKVSSDTTVNWTGTTNVTLTQPPNFNIYGY